MSVRPDLSGCVPEEAGALCHSLSESMRAGGLSVLITDVYVAISAYSMRLGMVRRALRTHREAKARYLELRTPS